MIIYTFLNICLFFFIFENLMEKVKGVSDVISYDDLKIKYLYLMN